MDRITLSIDLDSCNGIVVAAALVNTLVSYTGIVKNFNLDTEHEIDKLRLDDEDND